MCGFFGIFGQEKLAPIDENCLRGIKESLYRRGPDDSGAIADHHFFLFQQRLEIIDLNKRAALPMTERQGENAVHLVYNGECYNYLELKSLLEKRGHLFKTESDSEVMLKAYLEWGEEFISKVNGDFSLAIIDTSKKSCYIYRDRFGVKPLFFQEWGNQIVFASDMRAIQCFTKSSQLNQDVLRGIASLRYNPLNETIIKSIQKLEPGTYLQFKNKKLIKKYWGLENIPSSNLSTGEDEAAEKFYDLLKDSVRLRLRSHAGMGIFLSGGIDSSSIAVLSRHFSTQMNTFTVNVGGGLSEGSEASRLAKGLGYQSHEIDIESGAYQLKDLVMGQFDEPILDSIMIPTYKLAQEASNHGKVILSGEGADELLGGYVHQRAMVLGNILFKLFPFVAKKNVLQLVSKIPSQFMDHFFMYPSKIGKSGVQKLLKFIQYQEDPVKAYLSLASLFGEESQGEFSGTKEKLYKKLYLDWNEVKEMDFTHSLLKFDLKNWGTHYTLSRLDTLTMANSLEARVPFLDHRLAEFYFSLPSKLVSKPLQSKFLLRKALWLRGEKSQLGKILSKKKQPFFINTRKSYGDHYLVETGENHFSKLLKIDTPQVDEGILSMKQWDAMIMFNAWWENKKINLSI